MKEIIFFRFLQIAFLFDGMEQDLLHGNITEIYWKSSELRISAIAIAKAKRNT